MKQRIALGVFALLVCGGSAGHAQLAPVTVPRGLFRLEIGGEFRNADSRYQDGVTQDLARSFTAVPLGSGFFPSLALSEAQIAAITGNPAFRFNLGRSSANGLMNIGTVFLGLSYGLTNRITLFTSVPIVRTRMQLRLGLSTSGGEAGINPNDPALGDPIGQAQTTAFFSQFDAALATLGDNIANGMYAGNPQQLALAQQLLAEGTSLRQGFAVVFGDQDAPFVPIESSAAGMAIRDTITTVQNTFASLGVSGFSTTPALPVTAMDSADFTNFLSLPGGPVQGFPLNEATVNLLGDIEGGVSYLLADRWNQGTRPGGFRAAVTGTVRLPTGEVDRPENFLDIGTGTGHFAARVAATVDLGRGRIGARLSTSYEHSFAATLERRVAGPFQPVPLASSAASIRRSPGGLFDISAAPFFRLGKTLALTVGGRYRRRSEDQVSFASDDDSLPGVDASVMAQDTGWGLSSFLAGITYVSPASLDLERTGFPVEASWTIEGPLAGSGGIVSKERVMRLQLRMYLRL